MRSRGPGLALALLVLLAAPGCRFHLARVDLNRPLSPAGYDEVALGEHGRREVLARLGAPDALFYTPSELVFDYVAASHRGTDLAIFVPSDVTPGPVDPAIILALQRFLFDLFVEPPEFRSTLLERAARTASDAAVSFAPFVSGQDVVNLHGRQVRTDRLRVVFDRESLRVTAKALRLATGEYRQESLVGRTLLR
jgi:hypothetical protein